ncbi:MAG: thioredoxin family protein [Burkholderiaceae bacterium]|nr:thioredoxin family protein [Burkholderiaceae bacterium]
MTLAALAPGWAAAQIESTIVKTPQVTAELLAYAPQGVPVGQMPKTEADGQDESATPVWVGLQLTHQPGWHTYWKNSGDSGEPTQLEWTLPPGVMAGDIAWPLPRRIAIGNLANYGYEGTVLLPAPLIVTPQYRPRPLDNALPVHLKATWLVCQRECIPQSGEFDLRLPIAGSTALSGPVFQAAFAAQPRALADSAARATVNGQRLQLRVTGLPKHLQGTPLTLFPETPGIFVTAATPVQPGAVLDARTWRQAWQGTVWMADLPLAPDRVDAPATLPLVLEADNASHSQGWRVQAPVDGAWPPAAARAQALPTLAPSTQADAEVTQNAPSRASANVSWRVFLWALLGAFVGGLLLNLMPCVFPILAIKVLGFARHAQDRRAHRLSGLAYGAGVVVSFLLLGALMLALRAAGQQLGWGFQLQSPAVVAALAALFTVIGLNLAGVFEFGRWLPSRVLALEARHPVVNALLSGVLAVAVASPCTAPFMGASLGLTIALPSAMALMLFAAIGIGMALPYLAAGFIPGVAWLLPKPGAWMETLRRLLAFPMFGTVVWLVWVLGRQSGLDGAAALLALLVALALLLWALALTGRARIVITLIALGVLAAMWPVAWPLAVNLQPLPAAASSAGNAPAGRWQPWSPDRVQAALGAGHPVFVDFTAAWCVTCQVNEKTTLARADVLAMLDAAGVQTFRADWTRRDTAIAAQLQRLGRSGVPVYFLQAPGKPPVVLSELISEQDIRTALDRL